MKKTGSKGPKADPELQGANTRQRLMEVAGQLFAEKGFDRTTSKEITERAGANVAAVNYHFEGIEGLYAEVIKEASSLLTTTAEMQAAVNKQQDAKAKLEAFIGVFVRVLTSPASSSWRMRVLIREFAFPTLTDQALPKKNRLQKMSLLKQIVAELLQLPEDHPVVGPSCVSVMGPCFMLMVCDRPTLNQAFPAFALKPDDAAGLVQHIVRFALAGLAVVADDVRHAKDE